jgi:ABC-type multidrug transport system ATPase subunit
MQREKFIDEVLAMLELTPIANKLCSALSRGERKLLTVGVELAANPSVLFLDEPTTGLSYKSAAIVMRVLQVRN